MRYDIRLAIDYSYGAPSDRSRTLLRLIPADAGADQRLLSRKLTIAPRPDERREGVDFFGNATTLAVWHRPIDAVRLEVTLRVDRLAADVAADLSPPVAGLADDLTACTDLGPASPHHFTGPSPRVPEVPEITAFARAAVPAGATVVQAIEALGHALHEAMRFDSAATSVETGPAEAFEHRHGVCQDFAHVMIAGLRALGIPAGYVSGFLRTDPPPGRPRLEGADAMHAWVRAWAGPAMGWVAFDPTNDQRAGLDYVTVAQGRAYGDVAPVQGALRSSGGQVSRHTVDVLPVGAA